MAKYVVPPVEMSREIILKCYRCGALYVPDGRKTGYLHNTDYENCPVCGYAHNTDGNRIPLWKYNLIKYFREIRNKNSDGGRNYGNQADNNKGQGT